MFGFGGKKLSYHTKWFFVSVTNPESGLAKMNDFIKDKKAKTGIHNYIDRHDGTLFKLTWYEESEE